MNTALPADLRAVKDGRHPLTAAERMARILRDNTNNRFCTPFSRDPAGINTVVLQDKDKTHSLKRAAI